MSTPFRHVILFTLALFVWGNGIYHCQKIRWVLIHQRCTDESAFATPFEPLKASLDKTARLYFVAKNESNELHNSYFGAQFALSPLILEYENEAWLREKVLSQPAPHPSGISAKAILIFDLTSEPELAGAFSRLQEDAMRQGIPSSPEAIENRFLLLSLYGD